MKINCAESVFFNVKMGNGQPADVGEFETLEISDDVKDDGTVELVADSHPGVCDGQGAVNIDRAQAQQIVDHLTRVFSLEKTA